MIHVRDLSVSYGDCLNPEIDHRVLRGLSFHIPKGECWLIVGPSGSGKSTLGHVLAGLIPHAIPARVTGEVLVNGINTWSTPLPEIARNVSMVFQNPATQLFHLRVDDEVAFGPRNLGLPETDVADRVTWALDSVGLTGMGNCNPAELSGGQKQRLAIAAALAMQPAVLVLDEPTAALDVPGTQQVITVLQQLRQCLGITLVLIEHRLAEMAHLADRVLVLDKGQIVAEGATQEVFNNRGLLRQLGLHRPKDKPLMPWDKLLSPNNHPSQGEHALLELRGIEAGYHRQPVLQDINLTLYRGEFAALVGDNGSGKSTLALVMAGLLKPKHGQVIFGQGKRARPGMDVALLFQNPSDQLFTESVDEEISFGPRNYRQYDASFHEQVLNQADLLDLRQRQPLSLSMGQQQRTALAAYLALKPQLLILDEPTLGQDWGHLERLMDFLLELNRQGTTVLLITHDYKLVHHYARRVILLENGRITLDGRLNEMEISQ